MSSYYHTKDTVTLIDPTNNPATQDVTSYCFDSQVDTKRKSHETTVYGQDDEDYQGGLFTNTAKFKFRRNAALDAILVNLTRADTIHCIVRPAGSGSGKPQLKFDGFVTSDPKAAPLSNIAVREIDVQIAGAIDYTAQS